MRTASSEFKVPSVGVFLCVAQGVLDANSDSHIFSSRYNKTNGNNANSAGAAVNKWPKQYMSLKYTLPSFGHSTRNKLGNAECFSEAAAQPGGCLAGSVG